MDTCRSLALPLGLEQQGFPRFLVSFSPLGLLPCTGLDGMRSREAVKQRTLVLMIGLALQGHDGLTPREPPST